MNIYIYINIWIYIYLPPPFMDGNLVMKVNFGVDSYEFDQNECVSKQKINFIFDGYSNKEQVKCFQIYVNLTWNGFNRRLTTNYIPEAPQKLPEGLNQ